MPEPLAYLRDQFVPLSQAALHVFDLGVVTGASATEMMRTFRLAPFRLDDHLDRFFQSAAILRIASPRPRDELTSLIARLVEHNGRLIPPGHDLGITLFVTAGSNLTYLGAAGRAAAKQPTLCIHTFPLPFELWSEKLERGQHLVTPAVRQIPAESLDPALKCRSRAHWHIAEAQARAIAPDASALLLDTHGFVTETSTANLFVVRGNSLHTPPEEKTLHGVSQKVVRELANELEIPYHTGDLTPNDVATASEVFTSSTPSCLLPVSRFNGREIGDGKPGRILGRLLARWSEIVGIDIAAQIRTASAERRRAVEE